MRPTGKARRTARAARAALAIASLIALPGLALAGHAPTHEILAQARYRFCHEADYPLTVDEHAWCPLVDASNEDCPTLPAACALPPVEGRGGGSLPFARGRGGGRGRGARGRGAGARDGRTRDSAGEDARARQAREDARTRPEPERETRLTLPNLSGLARILLVGLIVVFVVAVVRALVQNFLRDRAVDAAPDDAPPGPAAPDAPAARGPIETDVERLLARARAAAARGDYGRAIDDTYAALLRRLDGDGLIDIHPSRTNGDYVRQLRERPDLKRAVRDIVGDVERVQFGATQPTEGAFRAVIERVAPLVARALGLVLLGFGLSASLSCAGHEGGDDDEAAAAPHADTSPSGTQAIVELLGKRGIKATHRSEPLDTLERPMTVALLAGVQPDEATWKHLLAWVHDKGGNLIIAGPEALPPELGLRVVPGDGKIAGAHLDGSFTGYGDLGLALPAGPRLEPTGDGPVEDAFLHRGAALYAVRRASGEGHLVIFADDALFSNIALTVGDNAAFHEQLFERLPPPREVELCDAWTGAGAATPFESVQRAELTPVIVQLFVLLGLLYLWKGVAFARLRDPPAETRRAFADHARALGLAYARARASRHVLGLYSVWALERLRERVHRSGRQGLIPLAEAIAARTGRSEAEIMRVLVDASSARDEAAPPSSFRPRAGASARRSRAARRDEAEADLILMRELSGFLTATGQRRPARRSHGEIKKE